MTRMLEQGVKSVRGTRTAAGLAAVAAIAFCTAVWAGGDALADDRTPQYHSGACQGAYPGWLRGLVDGYNDLSSSPVEDASGILKRVPTPTTLGLGDERLGFGDGLQAGFRAGVDYGVELGKAARAPQSNAERMSQATAALDAYILAHCGNPLGALDWNTTFMNESRTSTIASLNEAQVAMSLAAHTNQAAIAAEKLARGAQEAEAKGDLPAAMKYRAAAQVSARLAANFAQMARSHAATGLEEAVQAIIDAEAAAERAAKALESAGG